MPKIELTLKNRPSAIFLFILLLTTVTATLTKAQQFGGNPPSIKWHQINTKPAKVIFPTGLDSSAQEVANIIRRMNNSIEPTIGNKQKQVSIVLQNQTTVANAYVGLAPFRSEFYLTPEQNSFEIGSLIWSEQLAIHEFRHVQQYNNFNVGFSKVLHILFGEGGQALGNDLAIPNWFFEGDAVFNETLVSDQGRGRLPYFFNGYRALWAANKNYSWMKLRNGSYRDFTPDWYPTGYMLVAYGREKYGDLFWRDVTHDAAAYKGVFYPLQHAIKKYSGTDFENFRNAALDHFKKEFSNDVKADSSIISTPHFVANLEYPAYVNDSTMVYMKSTYNRLPAFTIRKGSHEKSIGVRSLSLDNYFAYHDGKIIYASYRPDLRWNYRDYSELRLLDVATGKEELLTRKSKYFAPDFSNDGKRIVAVQVSPSGKSDLHILNATDGKLEKVVPNRDDLFFTYPKFYGANKIVSAVRNSEGKMSLALIDINTDSVKYLLHFSYEPIAFPVIKNDVVYYSRSGLIDDLSAYNLSNGKQYWLPNPNNHGAIGYYEPAVGDHKLAWVGFTANGYIINEVNSKNVEWLEVRESDKPPVLPDWGISVLKTDSSADLLAKIPYQQLSVSKYSKFHNFFNFHSIIPYISDPDYIIAVVGENVLNTFQSQLSFDYNTNEGYKEIAFDGVYGSLFPFLRAGVQYTFDRRAFYKGGNVYWNETNLHGGLEFPLNFSSGRHITGLDFGSDINYNETDFQSPYNKTFSSSNYTYLNNYITFSTHIQQAKQNIYPRFGQNITLNYKTAIAGLSASQFMASANFFFPGLSINHNLIFNLAHQQKGDNYVIDFTNNFPFSRGYVAENLHSMNKIGGDYHFPIAYPDAGFANTIYFLRLRGDVYYDYTRALDNFTQGNSYKSFRSAGAAIFFDTKWFNQESISFGLRYSYLLDPDYFGGGGHNRFEIVLPVTFF